MSGYNSDYHEASERKDDALFQEFNDQTHYFPITKRNQQLSHIDYTCTDAKGRECSVELKRRQCKVAEYTHIYIEPQKFFEMLLRWMQYRIIPIYINFMKDGVLMFDLRQWENVDLKLQRVTINNHGYSEEKQETYRYCLPTDKAIMFIKDIDGRYIRAKFNKEDGRQIEQGR